VDNSGILEYTTLAILAIHVYSSSVAGSRVNEEITLITGPYRSGTSMLAGILELCGFNFGCSYRVLREPTEFNPAGHFEVDYVVMLNSYLLLNTVQDDVYRNWFPLSGLPDTNTLVEYCESHENYFRGFIEKFDGNICKDPNFCLTLPGWRRYWKTVRKVVFCLRDPVSSASSMSRRYEIPYTTALEIWYRYTDFFYRNSYDSDTIIFDLVLFYADPVETLKKILVRLNKYCGDDVIQSALRDRWLTKSIHKIDEPSIKTLPAEISNLYESLKGL
jgi:hypothetical protein